MQLQEITASESSSNPNYAPDITTFTFRGQSNANPYSNQSEDEARDVPSSSAEKASVFSSALLYEGGCVVSAEAIMCAGGEGYSEFGKIEYYDDEEDDETDDEDDDDDENDGHSSMLSNASLRRSKVGAGGFHRHQPPSQSNNNLQPRNDLVAKAAPEGRNHLRQSPVAFISAIKKEESPNMFGICIRYETSAGSACHSSIA